MGHYEGKSHAIQGEALKKALEATKESRDMPKCGSDFKGLKKEGANDGKA